MGLISKIANSKMGRIGAILAGVGTGVIPVTSDLLNPPAIYAQDDKVNPEVAELAKHLRHCSAGPEYTDPEFAEKYGWMNLFADPAVYRHRIEGGLKDIIPIARYDDFGRDGPNSTDKLAVRNFHGGELVLIDEGLDGKVDNTTNPKANEIYMSIVRALNQYFTTVLGDNANSKK